MSPIASTDIIQLISQYLNFHDKISKFSRLSKNWRRDVINFKKTWEYIDFATLSNNLVCDHPTDLEECKCKLKRITNWILNIHHDKIRYIKNIVIPAHEAAPMLNSMYKNKTVLQSLMIPSINSIDIHDTNGIYYFLMLLGNQLEYLTIDLCSQQYFPVYSLINLKYLDTFNSDYVDVLISWTGVFPNVEYLRTNKTGLSGNRFNLMFPNLKVWQGLRPLQP